MAVSNGKSIWESTELGRRAAQSGIPEDCGCLAFDFPKEGLVQARWQRRGQANFTLLGHEQSALLLGRIPDTPQGGLPETPQDYIPEPTGIKPPAKGKKSKAPMDMIENDKG